MGWSSVSRNLAGLVLLFLAAIVGILGYTVWTMHQQQRTAVMVDVAGRQRMLNQRYLLEVVLASQGFQVDYQSTRQLLQSSLDALIEGGEVLGGVSGFDLVQLPPAPTEAIRREFLEQKALIERFTAKANTFLEFREEGIRYAHALTELRQLNGSLQQTANQAVKLLDAYAESRVTRMIRLELAVAIVVGVLGLVLTRQVLQAKQALENEINERKRAEEEVRRSEARRAEAYRQSDALKSALLSSVSHELRTPLTAIKASIAGLLGQGQQGRPDVQQEFLKGMEQEIDYLTRLVDNLLDMSRIEAGTLVPQREWHVVEELVEGAIRRLGPKVQERTLTVDLAEDLPQIRVDGVEIQQLLVNLLDNAFKYSPEGSPVRLEAKAEPDQIRMVVANQGEGIPAEDLERIFERFHRVRLQRECSIPGSGLGLAICKGIVDAHGGRIWAESSPGQETRVVVTLPRVSTSPQPSSTEGEAAPPEGTQDKVNW